MKPEQQHAPINILLADDDTDDRFFFDKALKEILIATHLTTVNDGAQLMSHLSENSEHLPDVLFLDINMPRKNGFECLSEIKENKKLKDIPVVIYSTSFHKETVDVFYKNGADYYICKPPEISQLKKIVQQIITLIAQEAELTIANKKYAFQNNEKERQRTELTITNQKLEKAEEKIQFEKNLFEGLLESAPVGIVGINEKEQIIVFNRQAEIIFGYNKKEVIGKSLGILMSDKHNHKHEEFVAAYFDKPVRRQMGEVNRTLFGKRKNGELFPVNISLSCFQTTEGKISVSCILDITKQKLAEEKIIKSENQIRNFATHLNHIMEEEKSNIAREIHDELGQQLVGIKFGLSSFKKLSSNDKVIEKKIDGMMIDVDTAMQSMRKIATDLRPGILDTLGLISSIEWLAKEFERKTGKKCDIKVNVSVEKFEKNISICFFRICQEALTNISKHAEASEVIIEIKQSLINLPKGEPGQAARLATSSLGDGRAGSWLVLLISDNGKGIASEKLENPFSMGLLGMRERANIIGADLQVFSKKDFGTTIQLQTKLS